MLSKVGSGQSLHLTYADHLGTVTVHAATDGTPLTNTLARHEPFGGYRTAPTATNPSMTDRGFTDHKQNNTGTNDLDLIYMNARYYLPEIGRFVSGDTLVPDPHSLNNPSVTAIHQTIVPLIPAGTLPLTVG